MTKTQRAAAPWPLAARSSPEVKNKIKSRLDGRNGHGQVQTKRAMLASTIVLTLAGFATADLAAGVARPALPPMGWRSWNWFMCDIDQATMVSQIRALAARPAWADKSLLELGYRHAGLDDCWQDCVGPGGSYHDPTTGAPLVNTTAFPSLADMAREGSIVGVSVGFYGDNCRCNGGEKKVNVTRYAQDVNLTVSSGFGGYKVDSCGIQRDMEVYAKLFAAANAAPMVESCGNGPEGTNPKHDPVPMPSYIEQLTESCPWSIYRVSTDIAPQFFSTVHNVNRGRFFRDPERPLSRPGCWAYPDMLEVGVSKPNKEWALAGAPPPMTFVEWQTHFAMWAITSAPLILGFDLTDQKVLEEIWPIIANEEAIAVNQVWEGHPGRLVANASEVKDVTVLSGATGSRKTTDSLPSWQVWAKPVADGAVAVLAVRVWEGQTNATLTFSLAELFQGAAAVPSRASVRDVYARTDNGTVSDVYNFDLAALPSSGSWFVVLSPVG